MAGWGEGGGWLGWFRRAILFPSGFFHFPHSQNCLQGGWRSGKAKQAKHTNFPLKRAQTKLRRGHDNGSAPLRLIVVKVVLLREDPWSAISPNVVPLSARWKSPGLRDDFSTKFASLCVFFSSGAESAARERWAASHSRVSGERSLASEAVRLVELTSRTVRERVLSGGGGVI